MVERNRPAGPIDIAVVGHTNAGKTSLLRTLTRQVHFGQVSDRPGTTRHVEAIDLEIGGQTLLRYFDTPGLEDSVALQYHLKQMPEALTPPERVRALLDGPEARGVFEQEAKVLRQMLASSAAIYVIDCREPVLPKYRSEIEVLNT
ncbi:GTPase domain-containing protein [Hydrogenophaga sp. 2FB]|uniref:GTPase domain-containing protein n=1 Tax=Hydrogenophaga sp. 2FB TaxID=2502187 RepID=UPI001484F4FE|nr:GTPase domain-containing protein [Hydrogenophaga sp. 2FB]